MSKSNLLIVAPAFPKKWFSQLSMRTEAIFLQDLNERKLDQILPSVNCMLVHRWSPLLNPSRLSTMKNLKFVQCILGAVDHLPLRHIDRRVKICSNAGAYSTEVAEHAFALLLVAAKSILRYDGMVRKLPPTPLSTFERGRYVQKLKGKSLGILGYGNIGKLVAEYGKAFGMEICVYARRKLKERDIRVYLGKNGLGSVLEHCDAVVLALPLTKYTTNIIGKSELTLMKKNAILVNVGRAELVDGPELYKHLRKNSSFTYATDVWWFKDGTESFSPIIDFLSLENFIGTPHVAGPSAMLSGSLVEAAIVNLLRYLDGRRPKNVVDVSDYL